MTDEELAEIEERSQLASEGPWENWSDRRVRGVPMGGGLYSMVIEEGEGITEDDADFIAHARTDVPALVAEVRRLRSLFTEADVREVELYAGGGDPLYEVPELRDLAARLRQAIGEPVRYIGQPQADAIIQEMIDDGAIGEPEQRQSEEA